MSMFCMIVVLFGRERDVFLYGCSHRSHRRVPAYIVRFCTSSLNRRLSQALKIGCWFCLLRVDCVFESDRCRVPSHAHYPSRD